MMRAAGLALVLLTMPAIACEPKLPAHRIGYWHYRIVDHKPCWYGPGAHAALRDPGRDPARPLARIDVPQTVGATVSAQRPAKPPESLVDASEPPWPAKVAPAPLSAIQAAPRPVEPVPQAAATRQVAPWEPVRAVAAAAEPAKLAPAGRTRWPVWLVAGILAAIAVAMVRPRRRRHRPVVFDDPEEPLRALARTRKHFEHDEPPELPTRPDGPVA